jgi:putative ABC transport system ATP-binding protein
VIVVSTHDARLIPVADRVVRMTPDGIEPEQGAHDVHVDAGEVIFRQEDAPEYVYVIQSGDVEIVRELLGDAEERLALLGPGQYFGELGAMLGFPRSATARATSDVVLTAMPPHEFRAQVEQT